MMEKVTDFTRMKPDPARELFLCPECGSVGLKLYDQFTQEETPRRVIGFAHSLTDGRATGVCHHFPGRARRAGAMRKVKVIP